MRTETDAPRLAPHLRLTFDRARGRHVLLAPESITMLNETGAAILGLCDGRRGLADIVAELRARYDHVAADEVRAFLDRMAAMHCVEMGHG